MKAFTVLILLAFSTPALAADTGTPECVVLPEGAPDSPEEALQMAQKGVEYAKAKNWWGLSALIIFISMFVMKSAGLFKKIGKRWAYILVPSLSVIAMVFAKFAGDISWSAAAAVLTSGPVMAALSDLIKRGIIGKDPTTPMKAEKNG